MGRIRIEINTTLVLNKNIAFEKKNYNFVDFNAKKWKNFRDSESDERTKK